MAPQVVANQPTLLPVETVASSEKPVSQISESKTLSAAGGQSVQNACVSPSEAIGSMPSAEVATSPEEAELAQAASQKVSRVIKTVDEIAFRTNALALHAAIEAGRTGVAGMGFALVADEFRTLAQGAARAARETASSYEDCIRRRDTALQIHATVGKSLSTVIERAQEADRFVAQIARIYSTDNPGVPSRATAARQDEISARYALPDRPAVDGIDLEMSSLKGQAEALHRCVVELVGLV
jgi:methyl-accepting chemotaxis protein